MYFTFCSVIRGLHFAAYFSALLNQPGVTQEGVNTGAFFLFLFFFNAPPPRAVRAFFLPREGFSRPFPSSTMKPNFVY